MSEKPKKVLVLGSSALKIGEAGEFDYSGSQAIKALKDEGVHTVLLNPNIATIQTSEHLADQVYFLPVNAYFAEQVIEKERPDAVLLSVGGQTALNCGLELEEKGVLARYGVGVLGTPVQVIRETEDRGRFVHRLDEIEVKSPQSVPVTTAEEAVRAADAIGYPVMLRSAYALGGLGSARCSSTGEVRECAVRALGQTRQVLIEEYLEGWKEFEYEIVRDAFDNCITVCNMENIDPMGVHTGESIVVAPSQTLSNNEYHMLRQVAIRAIRHLGIVGECNIQFALDPESGDYRVIEVNARLSRSSALASKATGYPLAYIATMIALGHRLTEISNPVTKTTCACFEPALDYVIVKVPRWDLQKFRGVQTRIGSAMKSVGEVMAIGRNFEEALQKALRMLHIGAVGLVGNRRPAPEDLDRALSEPTPERVFSIAAALEAGYSLDRIFELSKIDRWFLAGMRNVVRIGDRLKAEAEPGLSRDLLLQSKQVGFSDRQIANLIGSTESDVRRTRAEHRITPRIKQVDTLAAEYPAETNYLYLTYDGQGDDVEPGEKKSVIVLGSGAYCIGSSVEFDWCCVNAVKTLREMGYDTIMINCNPETVSTDYNECDRLYFEEISLETILEIYHRERPVGVMLAMGGQVPNILATQCGDAGIEILGTSPENIDTAEDRHKFSRLLERLGVDQPEWAELATIKGARQFARKVGYPVVVRPSYVLSGTAMGVASNERELEPFLKNAAGVSSEFPVVISKFIENAKEVEVDGVADHGELVAWAISEHVENAGVHSGDATLVLPPQRLYLETVRQLRKIAEKIARGLAIHGPFNIQLTAKGNEVKVIECNLRASRSFPFVSKIMKDNFIELATRVIMGGKVPRRPSSVFNLEYVGVKAPQFSFSRLDGADPVLGVEMASTGEVACLGDDFEEAFLKALLAVGYPQRMENVLLSTGPIEFKATFLDSARRLQALGVGLFATPGTAEFLNENGVATATLHWPLEEKRPNTIDYLSEGKIDLVINIPKNFRARELTNDYLIRRRAVDFAVPLITNIELAQRFVEAWSRTGIDDLKIKSWMEYERVPGSVVLEVVKTGNRAAAGAAPGSADRAVAEAGSGRP